METPEVVSWFRALVDSQPLKPEQLLLHKLINKARDSPSLGNKNVRRGVILMAKYGRKAAQKVRRAMHERKRGTLKSGRSGKKVTSRKQAIAIGLSEARRAGGKVPRKKAKKK